MAEGEFSHVDAAGQARMVDVSDKVATVRTASARCVVAALDATPESDVRWSADVQSARLSGIQAAKRTADIIPLCHPLALDHVQVDVERDTHGWSIQATVQCTGRTGVEMEALTACAYCALSLVHSLSHRGYAARVSDLVVTEKRGGKSDWGTAPPD